MRHHLETYERALGYGVTTTVAQFSTDAYPVLLTVAHIATPLDAAFPVTNPVESTLAAALELLQSNAYAR